jgi:hypothetical protein
MKNENRREQCNVFRKNCQLQKMGVSGNNFIANLFVLGLNNSKVYSSMMTVLSSAVWNSTE